MKHTQPAILFLAAAVMTLTPANAQRRDTRDNDGDGRISRSEWTGNDRAFSRHDRNNDGYLDKQELPQGLQDRVRDRDRDGDRNYAGRDRDRRNNGSSGSNVDRLDRNRTGAVEGYEWPYNKSVFHQLDKDRNSVLTRDELNTISGATMIQLDRNNNQRIDTDEWPGGFAQFDDLDKDRNGTISSNEYFDRGGEWQRRRRFDEWDKDRNGIVSSTEWRSRPDLFRNLDRSGDGQLSWDEFMGSTEVYDRPFGWSYNDRR